MRYLYEKANNIENEVLTIYLITDIKINDVVGYEVEVESLMNYKITFDTLEEAKKCFFSEIRDKYNTRNYSRIKLNEVSSFGYSLAKHIFSIKQPTI